MRSAEERREEVARAAAEVNPNGWVGAYQIADAILPLIRQAQAEVLEEAAKVADARAREAYAASEKLTASFEQGLRSEYRDRQRVAKEIATAIRSLKETRDER